MSDVEESSDDVTDTSATNTAEPVHVESQSHLQTLVADEDVVLVDFYADWCGPCKMLEPVVAEIAAETNATVAKVDIDELQALAQENGVRGVPTLLLYADGELVERMVGVQEKSSLVGLIEQHG
ncbi:thioredoxin [Haloarchaeobius sp. FL176]|uniref:thioredoxin n=1 Tax=Haloarchaeobius sp. FL176 TaxID=2967129 RepID=UPI002148FCD0|nr:thioredoxin [Haloarchaeobius sp. FL176]